VQTEDCGAVGGLAKNQSKSNIPHYKPVENKKRKIRANQIFLIPNLLKRKNKRIQN